MATLELTDRTTLDPAQVAGATDVKLSGCALECVAALPDSVEILKLWWSAVPNPLRLDHLPRLKSLTINPQVRDGATVAIEALPAGLEKLDLWSCVVAPLPDPLPALSELRFDCCDTRAVRWDRLPASLENVSAVRCVLPEPLRLPPNLTALKSVSFYACNLRDARQILALPALRLASLGLTPLDEESVALLKAKGKAGLEIMGAKPAEFALTRQLYEMGVELSAEKKGKKARLHLPLKAVVEDFPLDRVMELADQVHRGKLKLRGQGFIDELRRERYAAVAAAKAAKQAAKQQARKPGSR